MAYLLQIQSWPHISTTQCRLIVTLAQHQTNIGYTAGIWWIICLFSGAVAEMISLQKETASNVVFIKYTKELKYLKYWVLYYTH